MGKSCVLYLIRQRERQRETEAETGRERETDRESGNEGQETKSNHFRATGLRVALPWLVM